MNPTKCYHIGSHIVTETTQLHFLLDQFEQYKKEYESSYMESIKEIKKTLNEGLKQQNLIEKGHISHFSNRFPDLLIEVRDGIYGLQENGFYKKMDSLVSISFSSPIVKNIISIDIKEENKEYQTKNMLVECSILFKNELKKYFVQCLIKDDRYWVVHSIKKMTNKYTLQGDKFLKTSTFKKDILYQILDNRIHLALTGHGYLHESRFLPIISFPYYMHFFI